MRSTFAPVAFAALAAAIPNPVPQAVTASIAPSASAPAGCMTSMSGTFGISVVNVTSSSSSSKRGLEQRQSDDSMLELTLSGGMLHDSEGRTGYIASNNQFQFDEPPQAGAIYTAGWSVCSNNSMALGGSTIFYQCLSGTFYNLYDESEGAQCNQVTLQVAGGSAVASQASDGQPTATPVAQTTDGQPQASTAAATPVSQITDGQPQVSTAAPVSQISDGQPQATTGLVSQLSDGQPQATTALVSQISDGQPQATTGVVSQISDGQPQAPTGANSTIASPTASVMPYTGAAAPTGVRGELLGLAAGFLAIAML